MDLSPAGLVVERGSRTENLADTLAHALERERPPHPLAAQTILVAHPGLRSWLLQRLARRGARGIAANYEVLLPWQWYERKARELLGDEALIGGAWRPELLRWHILAALTTLDAPVLEQALRGNDAPARRFELAEHLAGLFAQYLIYRPELIDGWENSDADRQWQAQLWRAIAERIGRPHRARRRQALAAALARDDSDPAPLHVFGVSHLPPDLLGALHAQARHRRVVLYFPDPCREHWVYLRDHRALLHASIDDPGALYFEVGHPLLAALGRVAQDFCLQLETLDAEDVRDATDEAEDAPDPAAPLLARVQSGIRRLEPDDVGAAWRARVPSAQRRSALLALRHDASLRVHGCHTRLRELEVLRDALLDRLAEDPSLTPADIVVMAPDVAAYAPLLPAVFGPPARHRDAPGHLPWHMADVALAQSHPLLGAFAQLLELAESRFALSAVLGLLDVPALARRQGIGATERATLERWLDRAHVAWGLDAEAKARAGGAPVDEHSWQFGLDRLFAGLLLGAPDEGHAPALLDDILPLPGATGGATQALGQLDDFLLTLRQWRDGFAATRTLAGWSHWLLARIEASFQADPHDQTEQAALDTLRRAVAALGQQGREARLDQTLPWPPLREVLRDALAQVPERQPFLLGGITVCGLVPQRSIPFRVVCLLGMNEGEFPRPRGDAGLSLIARQPRRGDRDARSEDRYLFLEALMAARDHLHLSYLAERARDGNPRNPAAPLAELLGHLDTQFALTPYDGLPRPWLLRHPLQPFDPRYFAQADTAVPEGDDPRLFSYQAHWIVAPASHEPVPTAVTRDASQAATRELALDTLKRFWRDPAGFQLLRQRGIRLQPWEAQQHPDREPLTPAVDRREGLERQLFAHALRRGHAVDTAPPAWLARSGVLAAGEPGRLGYAQVADTAQALLDEARAVIGHDAATAMPQALSLALDETRLDGTVDLWRTPDGTPWLLAISPRRAAHFGELLPLFIDYAALRLAGHATQALLLEVDKRIRACANVEALARQNDAQLRDGLRTLVALYRDSARAPLPFFPVSAWAWAQAKPDQRDARARAVWLGNGTQAMGERDYAAGVAQRLVRDAEPYAEDGAGDPHTHARFVALAAQAMRVLDPDWNGEAP